VLRPAGQILGGPASAQPHALLHPHASSVYFRCSRYRVVLLCSMLLGRTKELIAYHCSKGVRFLTVIEST